MTNSSDAHQLDKTYLTLTNDGVVAALPARPGPPPRVDGLLIGAPLMTRNAPHRGELHPDGDEILYVVSGSVEVVLEEEGGDRRVPAVAGQAVVVPRGIWHRVELQEPTRLLHITPGPGGDHRRL